jgi:TolB-like protein/Tfp pilus assembly protein PilF
MIYRFDNCVLDTERLELCRDGEFQAVEPQVFSLLVHLIENREHVVSKDDLIEAVWGGRIVSDAALSSRINAARRAVGDSGKDQAVIKTMPRRGFRFVAILENREVSPADDADDAMNAGMAPLNPADDRPSVVVLPFSNLSGDPEQDYFADGLAEDIITALSKIAQMRVIARHSAFEYKGQAVDLRAIAEQLGVRYVLEGSVRRGGKRLRITAQLIDASDGIHLWAERYDRPVDDLFDIQDEITKEIVTALRVELTDGETARVWARGTNNIDAWQYAVRAMELITLFTSSDYLEARALAEKATELDPGYAHAWAILGFTYWWDGRLGYTGDADTKFARAAEFAEMATTLDDSASWSIGLSALSAATRGRHSEGVNVARRGVELYPGNADVRAFLGLALAFASNYREAVEHFRAAMTFNPFYPNWYRLGLLRALSFLDEFDAALNLADEILEIEPANIPAWLVRAYIFGRIDRAGDARKAISEVRQLNPNLRISHMPGLILINDETAMNRFMDIIREAGLPE